jgi:8-oxo-dGTP diphosphatase
VDDLTSARVRTGQPCAVVCLLGRCSNAQVKRVVVGALIHDGRVLLVHRGSGKGVRPSLWDLPGGVIEKDESETSALARELREELGVEIAIDSASHLGRVAAGSVDDHALISAWVVREWHGEPANVAPDEHDDIGWFGHAELPPAPHVVVRRALLHAMCDHHG